MALWRGSLQKWVDSFHSGFNLSALLAYEVVTGDWSFADTLNVGYEFYTHLFFAEDGTPKYYPNSLYPIDIHSCSQALLVLSDCAARARDAGKLALKVLHWTEANMQSSNGSFYYQRHRRWADRVPYMRWGQAWMFRALARVHFTFGER